MTPQDQQMIDGLIDRVRSTQITDRDPDAAARLQQGLGGNPDAIYILAQTVLVQQHSLEQAHAQLDQMESQQSQTRQPAVPQQAQPTSWLDRFFGNSSAPQPLQGYSQQAPPQSQSGYQQVNVPAPPPYGYAQPGYPPQAYPPQGYGYGAPQAWGQSTGMGGGSFLRNAAQTAAGVAAGEMLFQGVESMFGGHHDGYGGREHESVVNNYYDDRGPEHEHHAAADTDSSFYNPKDDASRGDASSTQNFADTGENSFLSDQDNSNSFDVGSSSDDSGSDNSSFDDSSSSDDSN